MRSEGYGSCRVDLSVCLSSILAATPCPVLTILCCERLTPAATIKWRRAIWPSNTHLNVGDNPLTNEFFHLLYIIISNGLLREHTGREFDLLVLLLCPVLGQSANELGTSIFTPNVCKGFVK